MTNEFNFEQALKDLQDSKSLTGKNGILTTLIKQLTEAALNAELKHHLDKDELLNRKNDKTGKTIKHSSACFKLYTPRDRNGSFEPQLIKKNQITSTDEIDRKFILMFSLGMSYRYINKHVEDLYAINVSSGTINSVTDKLIPELKALQQRLLGSHYLLFGLMLSTLPLAGAPV